MSRPHRLSVVALVLLVSLAIPAVAQATAHVEVTDVTYSADGSFETGQDHLELWAGASHEFTATVETQADVDGEVCVVTDGGETTLGCRSETLSANSTSDVSISLEGWDDDTGTTNVAVEVRSNDTTVTTSETYTVEILRQDGDVDGDDLTNQQEVEAGSNPRLGDTDGDGLDDSEEVTTYETSPTNADTDGDGLSDHAEVERHSTDPTAADSDGDGLPDDRELELGTNPNKADTDGDGLDDALEVNTYETNATKADTDGDGLDDGAEINQYETNPTKPDTDDDGLDDALEVNTYETDPTTVDTDGDGLADGAEVHDHGTDPTATDSDGDGLADGQEINTHGTSPTTADTDDDGLDDGAEINQYGTDPTDADTDDDGVGDRAEVDPQPWGHLPVPVILLGALATVMSVAGGVLYRSDRGPAVSLPSSLTTDDAGGPIIDLGEPDQLERSEDDTEEVPLEFLSNEERIHRLLGENGGRMRQAEIVEETGWSKSKVSRVLSGMADADEIVKVDVGKGNVITLPERVPQGAESPFDE